MNYVKQLDRSTQSPPFLFSYRRCPYAIRARMALLMNGIDFDVYEISLRDKPKEMLKLSPKGTVPVLIFKDLILDESLDIMIWAKENSNVTSKINSEDYVLEKKIMEINDGEFKEKLDLYKYTSYQESKLKEKYRNDCEIFIKTLDLRLKNQDYLLSNNLGYSDIAIFPFIRQFLNVDLDWFEKSNYENLKKWVAKISKSELFFRIMQKP